MSFDYNVDDPFACAEAETRQKVNDDLTHMADHYEARYPDRADVRRDAHMLRSAARVAANGWRPVRHILLPEPDQAFLSETERLRATIADQSGRIARTQDLARSMLDMAEAARYGGYHLCLTEVVDELLRSRQVPERPAESRLTTLASQAVGMVDAWSTERRTVLADMDVAPGEEPEDYSRLDDAKRSHERSAWDLVEQLAQLITELDGTGH